MFNVFFMYLENNIERIAQVLALGIFQTLYTYLLIYIHMMFFLTLFFDETI
jgi:hypothetical protein